MLFIFILTLEIKVCSQLHTALTRVYNVSFVNNKRVELYQSKWMFCLCVYTCTGNAYKFYHPWIHLTKWPEKTQRNDNSSKWIINKNFLDLKRTAVLQCEKADIQNNTLPNPSPFPNLLKLSQIYSNFKYPCSGITKQI